jgi:hypothetical protein
MASRSFSEMDAPASFTAEYVHEHIKHYATAMGAVLPGAWMLNMRVRLSVDLQVQFGIVGPDDIASDEHLRQSSELHSICVNALLALIDRPTVAGHACVRVEKDSNCTRTGVVIKPPPPQTAEYTARLYVGNNYIMLALS